MKKILIFLILLFVSSSVFSGPWKECRYPDENYHDFIGRIVCQWIDLPQPLEYSLDFATTLGASYLINRALDIRDIRNENERLKLSLMQATVTSLYVIGKDWILFYGPNYDPNRWDNFAFDMAAVLVGFSLSYWNRGYFWIAPRKEENRVSGIWLNFALNF